MEEEDDSSDHEEYEFAECNRALLEETVRELRQSDRDAPRQDWPIVVSAEDGLDENDEHGESDGASGEQGSQQRKRPHSEESDSETKRTRQAPDQAGPEGSPVSGEPGPLPAEFSPVPAWPSPPPSPSPPVRDSPLSRRAPGSSAAETPASPLPCSSSELTAAAPPPPAAAAAGSGDGPLTPTELEDILKGATPDHLRLRAKELSSEENIVKVTADARMHHSAAICWIDIILTPKLLSGEVPSAALTSAVVSLAKRHPTELFKHFFMPLTAREQLLCEGLVQSVITEGLNEARRQDLLWRVYSPFRWPLSGAAVSLLLLLLPTCSVSAAPEYGRSLREQAADLVAALADAAPHHADSAPFARLLLVTAQRVGPLLEPPDRARLAAAAEQGRTPLRRVVQAALRRLEGS